MADFQLCSSHSLAVRCCFDLRHFYPLTLALVQEGESEWEGRRERGRPASQLQAVLFTPPTSLLSPLASSTVAVPWRDADRALSQHRWMKACFWSGWITLACFPCICQRSFAAKISLSGLFLARLQQARRKVKKYTDTVVKWNLIFPCSLQNCCYFLHLPAAHCFTELL